MKLKCQKQSPPDTKKIFRCEKCDKQFTALSSLERHMQLHAGHFRFYCDICRKGFNESINFSMHMRAHEGKRYKCEYCDKSYSNEINLKYHLSVHTGQYRLHCTLCGEGFNEGKLYEAHINGHREWRFMLVYRADFGNKIFSTVVTAFDKLFWWNIVLLCLRKEKRIKNRSVNKLHNNSFFSLFYVVLVWLFFLLYLILEFRRTN